MTTTNKTMITRLKSYQEKQIKMNQTTFHRLKTYIESLSDQEFIITIPMGGK